MTQKWTTVVGLRTSKRDLKCNLKKNSFGHFVHGTFCTSQLFAAMIDSIAAWRKSSYSGPAQALTPDNFGLNGRVATR